MQIFAPILKIFDSVRLLNQTASIKTYLLNEIKVGFVNYPYHWLEPYKKVKGIRLASKTDIAAMKLAPLPAEGQKRILLICFTFLIFSPWARCFNSIKINFPMGLNSS